MTTRFGEVAEDFYRTGEAFGKFGASDTEPRAVFAEVVVALYEGRDFKMPTTIRDWQLFSDMDGVGEAARSLTEATQKVIHAASADPFGLRRFVKDQHWD